MTDTAMQCAVCGHPLDYSEAFGWFHFAPDWRGDHVAVPVQPWSVPYALVCDFCRADVAFEDAWTVPAEDFETTPATVSVEHWLACSVCVQDVKGRRWFTLTERAVDQMHAREPMSYRERKHMSTALLAMYRQLEAHMTGEPRKAEREDAVPREKSS